MGRKRTLSLLDGASSGSADNPPIASVSRIRNPLFFCAFHKMQRHQPAIGGPVGDSPVPPQGRLARPANRSGGGSGWSGVSLCKQGEPDRTGDLLRVGRPGWRTGGIPRSFQGSGSSPDLPVGGAAVRPQYGHPTQASGKPTARSVCLSPKRYFYPLIRAKARALRHASRPAPQKPLAFSDIPN